MRRALSSVSGLELVSLLRTSPNKLYRQGVKDASELQDGFPVTREALFAYDALIIGSLEAAYLSPEQQRNIQDFVRVRGGTLLMLAGKNGLADGGWARSPVAQALPAGLDGRRKMMTGRLGMVCQKWLTFSASVISSPGHQCCYRLLARLRKVLNLCCCGNAMVVARVMYLQLVEPGVGKWDCRPQTNGMRHSGKVLWVNWWPVF